jgi:hypothetical protein
MAKTKKDSTQPLYNEGSQVLTRGKITRATPEEREATAKSDTILSHNNPTIADMPLIKRDPKTKPS